MKRIVIIGAGGLGRVVYNALQYENRLCASGQERYDCVGFIDDDVNALEGFTGYPQVIGDIEHTVIDRQLDYVLGIGNPGIRRKVALLFKDNWSSFPVIWTLNSNLDEVSRPVGISLGSGSFINGRLGADVSIGKFALINNSFSVGHNARIGDFCEIAPSSVISGGVELEEGVFVGSGAIIGPGVKVGAWSKISAGAVVLKDVEPCTLVSSPNCKAYKDFFVPYDERR